MKEREIRFFGGTVSAVQPNAIAPNQSQDESNARHVDGGLEPRRGYKNLAAPQSGFTAAYGLCYLGGYDSNYVEAEEYVSFEHLGVDVRAYTRSASTLSVASAITGATSLHASEWVMPVFNDKAYAINPNHTVNIYRHVIGDATSWVSFSVPANPTTALTFEVQYQSGGSANYASWDWTGTDAADVTVTGVTQTTNLAVVGGKLKIRHNQTPGAGSFEVDLNAITAGIQDLTYNDIEYFTLTPENPSLFDIDPSSITVVLTNNDGSPKTFVPAQVQAVETNQALSEYGVRIQFDNKTRGDWDNIRKFKVSYNVTQASATVANNFMFVSAVVKGCCMVIPLDTPQTVTKFGYSHAVNTTGLESGVAGEVNIPRSTYAGISPVPGKIDPLGVWIQFTMTDSPDSAVDLHRLYWHYAQPQDLFETRRWLRIVSQSDGTDTYLLRMSYQELIALTQYAPAPFKVDSCINAFPYREGMVWLYDESISNIRYSRVNDAEKQASPTDDAEDENRGATFTLAEGFADVPRCGVGCGGSAIIGGLNGVYEQQGERPSEMSPTKKFAGSLGVAGIGAMCRYKDDYGNAGAAFVDRHGTGVWFALPSGSGDRDAEGRVIELTAPVRGKVRSWLLDGQRDLVSDFSGVRLFVDESQDSLYVLLGQRAMKLPPVGPEGKREWEFYDYNTGSDTAKVQFVAASSKRRVRWMRSMGRVDELEFNQADGVPVEGFQRDGGNPMPVGKWVSPDYVGANRRILRIAAERGQFHKPVRIRIESDRKSQEYKIPENTLFKQCGALQQGRGHRIVVVIEEGMPKVSRVFWHESELGQRYGR